MVDAATKKTLSNIPLLRTKAGPRDQGEWVERLKEEYQALITVKCTVCVLIWYLYFTWFYALDR